MNYKIKASVPGGIWFDVNYITAGVAAAGGLVSLASEVVLNAVTGWQWQ
ncbi:hypothetical protein YK48G_13680 [Lentilactobacillus fungorum]|uniref:Uncharacterized protein n=1 Tax=Lentilactobacillus fungorum TaxID=2201250 RepID=A0ABQ3VZU5_9LACO|nr:hypothetical protein YK48G_13680 [Lentilactobacillus fungorum]